ncbi:hypothetical protein CMU99_16320 [Elizabethkingia anophelis]|nr:hypothetical protein [Elizabethkingia anophelis]
MNTQKNFQEEFATSLKQTQFPSEKVNENVIAQAVAMFHAKPLAELNVSAGDVKDVIKAIVDDQFNLYQLSIILNNIPSMSARDFGLTTTEYLELCEQVEVMGVEWNELMLPIKNKLVAQMNRETKKTLKKPHVNPNTRNR